MAVPPPLIVILGPTASGKSALALAVAQRLRGEILSVDSMQVYRGMDIGTAKPSAEEQQRVPHGLIDVVEPSEPFTVARFVEMADAAIAAAQAAGRALIATGGTPLYYKALFEGLFEGPGADPTLRAALKGQSNADLHARLRTVDPVAAGRIHLNDQKRLIRALEVYELTGQPISSLQMEWALPQGRHSALWFGLSWDRDELNRRINQRTRLMMQAGWLEECRRLLDQPQPLGQTAAEATGYHELFEHLRGRGSLEDAVEAIKIATRQLARRQMKWFRRFPAVRWLDGNRPLPELVEEVVATVD